MMAVFIILVNFEMLSFLCVISSSRIPWRYRDLAKEALDSASRRINLAAREELMEPGHYTFGGVSFHLTRPLVNPNVEQIQGFAKRENVIAIVQSKLSLSQNLMARKPLMAVPSEQKIFELGKSLGSDGRVELYSVSTVNPLEVFANLEMQTKPQTGYDCTLNETIFTGAKCKAWFSYNWPEAKDGEDPLSLKPIYHNITKDGDFQYRVGAYGQAVGQVALKFQGLFDLVAEFSVDINAVGGLGILVKKQVYNYNLKIYEFKYPIYGIDFEILGIKIGFGVEAYVGFLLNNITMEIPELEYYRDFVFNFHKQGKLSTKSGYHGDPYTWDIHSDTYSNLDNNSLIEYIEGMKLGISPTVDMGIRAIAYVGSLLNTDLAVGSDFHLDLGFGFNMEKCTLPYIYTNAAFGIDLYLSSIGVKILGLNIVPGFKLNWPVFQSKRSADICLFSSKKSQEGVISMTSDTRVPSVVIKPEYIFPKASAPNSNKFNVRLNAYPGSDVPTPFRSLQLEPVQFSQGSSGPDAKKQLNRVLVLTNPRESTVMKYTANWAHRFQFQDEFQIDSEMNKEICGQYSNSESLCIRTQVNNSQTVEEFKEFDANKTYISIKPSNAKNGDIYGVITHGDGDAYKAPLDKYQTLDDAALDSSDIRNGEYLVRRYLNVKIDGLKRSDSNADVQLDFFKCVDSDCSPLGSLYAMDVPKNVYVTAAQINAQEFSFPFDLSGQKFTLQVKMNNDKVFEFTRDEINFDGTFKRSKSIESDKFQLALNFENTIPTILFQTGYEEGKTNYKGIIAKVFQPTQVWTKDDVNVHVAMKTNETYGILRFFFNHGDDQIAQNTQFNVIMKGQGFTPLCDHTKLDDQYIAIPLTFGETLFSTKQQQQYFPGALSINIPIRRTKLEAAEFDVALSAVFISGDKAVCSVSNIIKGKVIKGLYTGCIDTLTPENHLSWTPLFTGISDGYFEHFRLEANNWALEAFRAKDDLTEFTDFEFRTRFGGFNIPENASSLFIPGNRTYEFANANKKIYIQCDKCTSLRAETSKQTMQLEKVEGKYVYNPDKSREDVLFVVMCDDKNHPYCEFEEDFSDDGLALLEYLSDDGVLDIKAPENSLKLQDSVRRQIVYGRNATKLVKTWKGTITRLQKNMQPGDFKLVITANNDKTSTITAMLGSVIVPLSAAGFRYDPIKFLDASAIIRPQDGFKDGDLIFTANGSIIVRNELLGNVFQNVDNVKSLTDLPASYVYNQEVVCGEKSRKKGNKCVRVLTPGEWIKQNPGAFAGIIIGFVALFGLIALSVVLIKRRRRQNEIERSLLTNELASGLQD